MKPVLHTGTYLLLLSLVVACETTIKDVETSPYYTIPAGSQITLNRKIHFVPNSVSVYLQNGSLTPSVQLDRYEPHCKFELYKMLEIEQTIEPETFNITRSTVEEFTSRPSSQRYAALGMTETSGGSISHIEYTTYLYLSSEKQPNVYLLSCLYWGNPEDNHLTVAEIRRALGEIMTLKLTTR